MKALNVWLWKCRIIAHTTSAYMRLSLRCSALSSQPFFCVCTPLTVRVWQVPVHAMCSNCESKCVGGTGTSDAAFRVAGERSSPTEHGNCSAGAAAAAFGLLCSREGPHQCFERGRHRSQPGNHPQFAEDTATDDSGQLPFRLLDGIGGADCPPTRKAGLCLPDADTNAT